MEKKKKQQERSTWKKTDKEQLRGGMQAFELFVFLNSY